MTANCVSSLGVVGFSPQTPILLALAMGEHRLGRTWVYVNPITSKLLRVKTALRVLELSEKSFAFEHGTYSVKPVICFRIFNAEKYLKSVEDADKFVTSLVLSSIGSRLANSTNFDATTKNLQHEQMTLSRIISSQPNQDHSGDNCAGNPSQCSDFTGTLSEHGIEIIWVEFRNAKLRKGKDQT
ncbi:hypothetical protein BJX70DRAFT_138378 [Aspergillus crustosus]